MGAVKLKPEAEKYIRTICNGNGNSLLSGKNKYVLPYCSPQSIDVIWTSNPDINGGIKTNSELGEALIKWYNKYANIYQLDVNILAAQAYQESLFKVWNYAKTSTASGICQFISVTVFDVIMRGLYGKFTDDERKAISRNVNGYTFAPNGTPPKNPFIVDNALGRENRAIIHQNIIDNPEIMIKAQFVYMNYISERCDKLASCALFGYNRGPGYVQSSSYVESINNATKKGGGYEKEGIDYVYKIFKNLFENFGYSELDITEVAAKNFSSPNSKQHNSNLA
jgi:hypothetical protein